MKNRLFEKRDRKKIDAFVAKHFSDGKTLDLGCGTARYKKLFPNRVGFDRVFIEGVDVVGDVHELPFQDASFDTVLCTEVLEHAEDPRRMLSEANRVLKTGGVLILTTRFIYPLHETPYDYWRFTKYGLQILLNKDWELEEMEEESTTVEALSMIMTRLPLQIEANHRFLKLYFVLMAWLMIPLRWIIKKEYGDIRRDSMESIILTTGYHVFARKK